MRRTRHAVADVGHVAGRAAIGLALALLVSLSLVGSPPSGAAPVAPPAVDFGSATSAVQATPTRSVSLAEPAGASVGDVLVASFTADHSPGIAAEPEGWTSVLPTRLTSGSTVEAFAYYRVVTEADIAVTSWTWTLGSPQAWSGGIARYVGADPTQPVETALTTTSSSTAKRSLTVPGTTTTTDGTMLIGGVGVNSLTALTVSPPADWTEVWETGAGQVSEHAYRPQPTAGATGEQTWTLVPGRRLVGWMAALQPAPAPTPTGPPPTGPPPTASFAAAPIQGTAPLTVAFTDTSTGTPTSWQWTFGDGATSVEQNPSHVYAAAGSYTVSLQATNAAGTDTVTHTDEVVVAAPPSTGSDVLVGAGDIAGCSHTEDSATGALVAATAGTVFTLGDNVYPNGTTSDFASCYDPAWGAVKSRTRPVVGNHEYNTADAAPYYDYFGAAAGDPSQGWYSYDLGVDWHVVVLNSNCAPVGGCGTGSSQEQWLRADLAASARPCTVAMWHHPRFSSGEHGDHASMAAFWTDLYADGAELVLNGHDHDYERFKPQAPSGALDEASGIRELVVGTGGVPLRALVSVKPNSEVRDATSHGVLRLTLDDGSYGWSFVPIPGDTFSDSGTGSCHDAPPSAVGASASADAPSPTAGMAVVSQ